MTGVSAGMTAAGAGMTEPLLLLVEDEELRLVPGPRAAPDFLPSRRGRRNAPRRGLHQPQLADGLVRTVGALEEEAHVPVEQGALRIAHVVAQHAAIADR